MATFNLTSGVNYFGGGNDADIFTGPGGGGDYLDGGGGADTFNIDGSQIGVIVGGAGVDTLNILDNSLNLALWVYGVENLVASSSTNLYATADQLASFSSISLGASAPSDFFFFLQGAGGAVNFGASYQSSATLHVEANMTNSAVYLIGTARGDSFLGSSFNDTLVGGAGADTMNGMGGNDAYSVDTALDQVSESAGQGTDTVLASVSYALSAGQSIEDLRTTNTAGTGAIKLTGNEVAQNLYGNQGANTLNGLGGADTMTGFGGNDSYLVDVAGDRVVEAAGGGTDIVYASTSYTLGAGQSIEVLRTFSDTGTTATNLTGNEQANMLIGNAGINILDGGAGKDSLTPGNDTAVDTIRFSAVSHSTSVNRDTVTGMDFNEDKLDFTIAPTSFAVVTTGALNEGATFDANLATAVNAALAVNGAALLDPNGGTLNMAGHYYLVVDANGDGSYTAGSDYVLQIVNPTGTLDLTDFV